MKKKILLGIGILLGIVVISMIAIWVISDTKAGHASFDSNVDGVAITKQDVSAMGDISGDFVIPSTLNGRPVTSIGDWAFSGCKGLTSVTIPSSVTSIGSGAFEMCKSLTSVTIPSSVTTIGDDAFWRCDNLWKDENGVKYESANKVVLIDVPESLIGNFVIPTSVRFIHSNAFSECKRLTSVTIPSSVTTIGAWAFDGCSRLTSVTIPDSVTSIGDGAFEGCRGLTSVTIPDSVTSIGDGTFWGCDNLWKDENGVQYESANKVVLIDVPESLIGNFVIPTSVRFIHSNAFWMCKGLISVTMPDSVTSIGALAFRECSGLTSVTIPSSVTTIGVGAFAGCSSLTLIIVDSANQHYSLINNLLCSKDGKTLVACPGGLTSVMIPDSVTTIGAWAFDGCSRLTSVTIPSSVTSIGNYAFLGCDNLWKDENGVQYESANKVVLIDVPESLIGNFVIPTSVRCIYSSAFSRCSGLTSVTIPDSVTTIGVEAFDGCSRLTSVTIPSSVTSIGEYAFRECYRLTSVTFKGVPPLYIGWDAFDGSSPTGYYLPEHAAAWEAEMDEDGRWHGLKMEQR